MDGWLLAAVLSDGTLVTLAAAMLAVLVKPRLFPRVRILTPPPVPSALGRTVLCLADASGTVRSITPNAARVLGPACDQAAELGLTLSELLETTSPEPLAAWYARVWLTNDAEPILLHTRGGPANDRWVELAPAGRTRLGMIEVVAFEVRDASDRAEHERRSTLLSGAMRAAAEAVYITDAEGRIEHVNGAFERISGLRAESVTGRPASVLASGRHRPEFFARMWESIRDGGHFTGDVTNRRPDGTCYTLDLSITSVRDGDGVLHYIAVGRDITQRRVIEQQMEDLAFRDPLTGLGRLRLLRERSDQLLALTRRHGSSAALIRIDVEEMRAINARYGRSVGDDVLRAIAERLRVTVRDSDALARGSGASFLVLLSELGDEAALGRVVRRLHERVTQPCRVGSLEIDIAVHAGIAVFPQDASSFDELREQADAAQERAAQLQTALEFYSRERTLADRERAVFEQDLSWAWEHDQFTLHYRPIIGTGAGGDALPLPQGNVAGVEALPRWRNLERGMLAREQFQPLLEQAGLATELDRWAIAGAVRQAASWLETGWLGWITAGVSPCSLRNPDMTAFLARTLDEHRVPRSRLIVQIGQTAVMQDVRAATTAIDALRASGIRVALDAFGVAPAAVECLTLVSVDLLMLEPGLVAAIGRGGRQERMLRAYLDVAHRLGTRVVATGVELEDQRVWLERAGCAFVQGPLVGAAAPPDALPHLPPLPTV